ncbi:MAG TPA: hypothetical protein VFZ59_05065 [Verrucomicrobiae bacterium]|nr:hypothetical protein [Verrucomicrobiae bacterium]
MKRLCSLVLVALVAPLLSRATDATYFNSGLVTFPPQVDATNFVNIGTFQIATSKPFDTSNTRNFTNNGTLQGSVGFRFDTVNTANGLRTMAANYFNGPNGLIQALDSPVVLLAPCAQSPVLPSYLWISATNIVGGGRRPASMLSGPNGEIRLDGKNVNLSRSGLEVTPVWASPAGTSTTVGRNEFTPDLGISDLYWAQAGYSQNYPLTSGILWNGTIAQSRGGIQPPQGSPAPPTIALFGPFADSYINPIGAVDIVLTNFTGPSTNVTQIVTRTITLITNLTKGAVFVGANGSVAMGFTPSQIPTNNFQTIEAIIAVDLPNAVTGLPEPAYIWLSDELASSTNRGFSANQIGCPPVGNRPRNYLMDRIGFIGGGSGNHGYPEANFFLSSSAILTSTDIGFDSVTNTVVEAGEYAAYGATANNLVSTPPLIPAGTYTNIPGRVRINADNLNLSETRIRAEGSITINTPNLISSSNAVIDCQNLDFNLASTNGSLRVQSMARDTVARLTGTIQAWSAVWNNTATVIITNNYSFTNVVTEGTNVVATVLITNTAGTTDGQTITVNGELRTWRDAVTTPATEITTATTINQAAANLLDQASTFPFTGVTAGASGLNGVTLRSPINGNIDVQLSAGWGTVSYATNSGFTNIVAELLPLTNTVIMGLQTLMVDATALTTTQPVVVQRMVTHSTNLVVDDNLNIGENLSIDAQHLSFNGDITLQLGSFQNWNQTAAPNVLFFTNAGYFFIFNEGHFGDDRLVPYSSFVNTNTGTVDAWVLVVNSDYFQNNGTLLAVDSMTLQFLDGKLEGGSSSSGFNTDFFANTLKFDNYALFVGGTLNFNVTGSLFDTGESSNLFVVDHGFNLLIKPQTGDLLGSSFTSEAPDFAYPIHTWAGEDRGASPAGYANNVAIGELVLSAIGLDPYFTFSGTGSQNGLYTDMLDLSSLGANYANELQIDPNLTIYYAAARLGVTPPQSNGVPQLPEEYLDGQFGGRLRWVPGFAGPNSSTDVIINGQTAKVNRALRNSQIIDSDGDGVPNFSDPTPFDSLVLTGTMPVPQAFTISWQALPNVAYKVEYTTNDSLSGWQTLTRYTNNGPTKVTATVWDTNAVPGAVRKFYRVSY